MIATLDEIVRDIISSTPIKTAKIEVSVAEHEKDSVGFYEKCGFLQEGKLSSYYDYGVPVYVMGKEIK